MPERLRDERGRFRRCACWCHGVGRDSTSLWRNDHRTECDFPDGRCYARPDPYNRLAWYMAQARYGTRIVLDT